MATDPADLVTVTQATAYLAAGGVTLTSAQVAALQGLVTAASVEIQRELHRVIPAADYDEVLTPTRGRPDRGEPDTVTLSRYPVNSVTVYGGRTAALRVVNADAANQLALVAMTLAGDPDTRLTATGLTLTRVASGVGAADSVPFSGLTVRGVADAVNALGHGWSATAYTGTPDPSLFPATLLAGAREARPASGSGCVLAVFATVLPVNVDRAAGLVEVWPAWGGGGGWYGAGAWYGDGYDDPDTGPGTVRVVYNAGYATIPAPYQDLAAEVVKAMLERLRTDITLASESAGAYSYTARAVLSGTALQTVLQSLQKYKDFSL